MGGGLKQQWGVGDPTKAGSDKQAQQFTASFHAHISCINGHLQYTSANAEAARHGPLEARRDALYTAYQSALSQIDRKDPGKAKGAIDKVLGDAKALETEAAKFRAQAQKAKNDWVARQPKFDAAVHQVEELEAWEDARAPVLRTLADGIRTNTNDRRYAPASATLDQFLPKLKPIYDEYLKQKAAKPKYEQVHAEQSARLESLKAAERPSQPMTAKAAEIDAALQQAQTKAEAKDYVAGVDQLKAIKTNVDALDKLAKDPQRAKFLVDSKTAAESIKAEADATFKSLEADWQAIDQSRAQADTTADSGDYAAANKLLGELKAKYDLYKAKHEELKKQKQAYDDALASFQPQLVDALKSTYTPLKARLDEITKGKGEMEAAAQKDDYVAALQAADDLKAKVTAFLPDLQKLQQAEKDYTAEAAKLKPKLQDALVSARNFTPLKGQRDALVAAEAGMETAATAQDFEKALQIAQDLQTKVDEYLKAATAQEDDYKKKGDAITKKLDDANFFTRDGVARDEVKKLSEEDLKHLPTPIRNRLMQELQSGNTSDEDKESLKKLYSVRTLDPEFEKLDDAARKKMIDKMKTDPAFKSAREHWDTMSEKERVAIMEKAIDIQADAYGIPKTKIETYDKDDATDYGYYRHSDGKLHVNGNDAALKKGGFDEAIDTAVHENGHRYQHTLIDKLDKGEIKEGDPLYNQAMTFKLNSGYYVQPVKSGKSPTANTGPEYFSQPMENHSRITGQAVKDAGLGK